MYKQATWAASGCNKLARGSSVCKQVKEWRCSLFIYTNAVLGESKGSERGWGAGAAVHRLVPDDGGHERGIDPSRQPLFPFIARRAAK